jgi:hypothetical protein
VIRAALLGDEAGRKVNMNAYPTLRLLFLSSSLLALPACGVSVLGGGNGGHDGSGGSGAGTTGTGTTGTGTTGTGTTGTGTTGTGTGGSCTPSPGDHMVSTNGYSVACTKDSDCTVVFTGDICGACTCPGGAAIATADLAMYQQQVTEKHVGCCPPTMPPCQCPVIAVPVCQQGTCYPGMVTDICGGQPSPESCTASSCPSGWTCMQDPDPTTCHPSNCSCVNNAWVCSQDCMMNGSTCYKGI